MDIRHYWDGGRIIDAKNEKKTWWFLNHPSEMITEFSNGVTFFFEFCGIHISSVNVRLLTT